MRKWDAVTPGELITIIEYLKHNFDLELSHKVIELFHERMQDDEHIDHDVLCYLMKHVFAQIMTGKSADQAFGLKPKRGDSKRKDTFDRDIAIAAAFIRNKRKEDTGWEDARFDTAESFGVSESTVQRAYDKFSEGLELVPDDLLKEIAGTSPLSP
jgi:hypothetical protein